MTLPATVPQKSVEVGSLGFAPTNATELMQMAKFIAAERITTMSDFSDPCPSPLRKVT